VGRFRNCAATCGTINVSLYIIKSALFPYMIMGSLDLRGMIFLTGQEDRGNLRAFNGGADGVTDSRQTECKAATDGILPVGRFSAFLITFASWKPDPKAFPTDPKALLGPGYTSCSEPCSAP
jgi:hypothetical protein